MLVAVSSELYRPTKESNKVNKDDSSGNTTWNKEQTNLN